MLNRFFNTYKFLAIFANNVKLWKDIAYILTILLNIMIMLTYSNVFGDRMGKNKLFMSNDFSFNGTKQTFRVIGILLSVFSFFVVSFFLSKNVPLIYRKVFKVD